MCDFSRVSAWFCDEKISLKKSCFYLYIRRNNECYRSKTTIGSRYDFYDKRAENASSDEIKEVIIKVLWALLKKDECAE